MESTVIIIIIPGKSVVVHQIPSMISLYASLSMLPQLGRWGGIPGPRKLKKDSVRMAWAVIRVTDTTAISKQIGHDVPVQNVAVACAF
jgi:hypothetical protein